MIGKTIIIIAGFLFVLTLICGLGWFIVFAAGEREWFAVAVAASLELLLIGGCVWEAGL